MCLRTCMWLEKLEPLLESGHDLAVTHRERKRGERRERRQQQPKTLAEKQAGAVASEP